MARPVPLSRFTSRVGGGSAFFVKRIAHTHTGLGNMRIAATSRSGPLGSIQHTIYLPHDSAPLLPAHTNELMKAMSAITAKDIGAVGIGTGAWQLTTIPHATTQQELTNIFIRNNVSAEKAPVFASELRQLLSLPWVRTILIGASGAAFVYLVVGKTRWSRKRKWA